MSHWQLGDQETAGEWYDKALVSETRGKLKRFNTPDRFDRFSG